MKIFKNRNFIIIFGLSLGFLILASGATFLRLAEIKTPLIIHFDAFKGIDFLGDRFDVLKILIVALVIILINLFLAEFIFDRQRFLSFVFAYVGLVTSALTLIAIAVIISIN
ncbi:MAG: hypothetical protein Q8N22_00395 [bacterium]|nr:hypothetical protein [bacterium]